MVKIHNDKKGYWSPSNNLIILTIISSHLCPLVETNFPQQLKVMAYGRDNLTSTIKCMMRESLLTKYLSISNIIWNLLFALNYDFHI